MDIDLELRFKKLQKELEKNFSEELDVTAILFLIGVQELGKGVQKFSKQEKTELIHVAICTLLEKSGFYTFIGKDEDGWPHFKLTKKLPYLDDKEQKHLIKEAILDYFEF
ncbi:MAG: hypothetical protein HYU67_00855 [Flavobacteriia bacterium]|nr:hypothetical protein [Flavobacteriia bacterium]